MERPTTRQGSVDATLRGLIESYLAGRTDFDEFGGSYMSVFLNEPPERFRSPESWLLFSLISDQLAFVAEESQHYGAELRLEADFRSWLRDAAKVLEGPGW
jgi:hypothetical protein